MQFPKGFYFGASTSAFQVEGGIENIDWAAAARKGLVPNIGTAADHYHRYEEDFDIAKELGHNAHRFSIEWARIEPEEGQFNEAEIEHYRDVLRALHERGITPFITLWHFTLPLWFSESGGFGRDDAPEIFARYCVYVTEHLSDLCVHFSTINEPNVYAGHGYLYGVWPPFKRGRILFKTLGKEDETAERSGAVPQFRNVLKYFKVVRTLERAHCAAYHRIKQKTPTINVSVVKHVRVFHANWNPYNKLKAALMQYLQTYSFMNAVIECCDEVGLNYYRMTKYGDTNTYDYTDMGWKVVPEYIEYALKVLWRYKKPIFIAEAGLADADDDIRAEYITRQIEGTLEAYKDGVDVRGHMYWSLLDNYELALGYEKRFGLVEIDYTTLKRTIRQSAWEYKKLIEKHNVDNY